MPLLLLSMTILTSLRIDSHIVSTIDSSMSLLSLCFVLSVWSVPMRLYSYQDLVYLLIGIGAIPDSPRTIADWDRYRSLSIQTRPECPLTNEIYSCDANGSIASLNLTSKGRRAIIHRLDLALQRTVIRDFVGHITFGALPSYTEVVNSAWLSVGTRDDVIATRLSAAPLFIMRNVSLPYYDFTIPYGPLVPLNSSRCQFFNVSMLCPIPRWLWPCFNATTVAPPCVQPPPPPLSTFGPDFLPCYSSGICHIECTPPPADGFFCDDLYSTGHFYFPQTPGFAVLDVSLSFASLAVSFDFKAPVRGLVRQIEIWDWLSLNWTVLDFGITERKAENNVEILLPPVLTNRIRTTFELWFPQTDAISTLDIRRTRAGEEAPVVLQPLPICAPVESFSSRSMLDETLGDSFCVGRICQLACQRAANFTFDRAVLPRFVVIEGGALWPGANLVATPSLETRIYSFNASASLIPIKSVEISSEVGAVSRVRLIGDPPNGESLPAPVLPNQLGLPGIFVKRTLQALPPGYINTTATLATNSSSSCATLSGATVVSTALVASTQFAFTADGSLLKCITTTDAGWTNVTDVAKLSRLTLNIGSPTPSRKLVAISNRLLAVVSASSLIHDGSVLRLFVNRRITQTAIDVLDVSNGVWFNNLLQHDIRTHNISDIDVVVHQNASSFGVVARATSLASVFDWRAFPFVLVECETNVDCLSCLTNEANIQACRWCGTRCTSQQVSCFANETSVARAVQCPEETTTTAATTSTTTATTATTSLSSSMEATATSVQSADSTSILESSGSLMSVDAADPLVPLYIVVGLVGGFIVIGALVAVVWWFRRQDQIREAPAAEPSIPLQDIAKPALDSRPSPYEDGHILSENGPYEDGNFNS